MAQTNSRFFSVMAVGEEPQKMMEKYGADYEVEPYVKYKYLDAKKYQQASIKTLEKLLNEADKIGIPPTTQETLKTRLEELKKQSSFEYYRQLTDGMYYDEDGNALSTENPNAHFNTCRVGRNFSMPLLLKNGMEAYSAHVSEVDWESMIHTNTSVYEAAWEMVMEGKTPSNPEEEAIYNAMKDKEAYFSKFKSEEEYVNYSTSYWNYAFVDKNGWIDVDIFEGDETEWVSTFYDRFIKNLDPNELITIFECSINNG